jgi:hypothetical protein
VLQLGAPNTGDHPDGKLLAVVQGRAGNPHPARGIDALVQRPGANAGYLIAVADEPEDGQREARPGEDLEEVGPRGQVGGEVRA